MAFRRRVVARRPRAPVHWTGTTEPGNSLVAGTLDEFPIVVSTDYSSNANVSPSGVTCIRVVGDWGIRQGQPSTVGTYVVDYGIAHIDDDEVAAAGGDFDPSIFTQLNRQRWLWVGHYCWSVMSAVGQLVLPQFHFDIKQKVRLRDSGISLFIKTALTNPGSCTGSMIGRALLRGDTN